MELIGMIVAGMMTGWLAAQFMTGKGFGVIGDIVTGMAGGLIGGLLLERTGLIDGSSLVGSLLAATSGAIVFLYGVRVFKKA